MGSQKVPMNLSDSEEQLRYSDYSSSEASDEEADDISCVDEQATPINLPPVNLIGFKFNVNQLRSITAPTSVPQTTPVTKPPTSIVSSHESEDSVYFNRRWVLYQNDVSSLHSNDYIFNAIKPFWEYCQEEDICNPQVQCEPHFKVPFSLSSCKQSNTLTDTDFQDDDVLSLIASTIKEKSVSEEENSERPQSQQFYDKKKIEEWVPTLESAKLNPVNLIGSSVPECFKHICYHHFFYDKCTWKYCMHSHALHSNMKFVYNLQNSSNEAFLYGYEYAKDHLFFFENCLDLLVSELIKRSMFSKISEVVNDIYRLETEDKSKYMISVIEQFSAKWNYKEVLIEIINNIDLSHNIDLSNVLITLISREINIGNFCDILNKIIERRHTIINYEDVKRLLDTALSDPNVINKNLVLLVSNIINRNLVEITKIPKDLLNALETYINSIKAIKKTFSSPHNSSETEQSNCNDQAGDYSTAAPPNVLPSLKGIGTELPGKEFTIQHSELEYFEPDSPERCLSPGISECNYSEYDNLESVSQINSPILNKKHQNIPGHHLSNGSVQQGNEEHFTRLIRSPNLQTDNNQIQYLQQTLRSPEQIHFSPSRQLHHSEIHINHTITNEQSSSQTFLRPLFPSPIKSSISETKSIEINAEDVSKMSSISSSPKSQLLFDTPYKRSYSDTDLSEIYPQHLFEPPTKIRNGFSSAKPITHVSKHIFESPHKSDTRSNVINEKEPVFQVPRVPEISKFRKPYKPPVRDGCDVSVASTVSKFVPKFGKMTFKDANFELNCSLHCLLPVQAKYVDLHNKHIAELHKAIKNADAHMFLKLIKLYDNTCTHKSFIVQSFVAVKESDDVKSFNHLMEMIVNVLPNYKAHKSTRAILEVLALNVVRFLDSLKEWKECVVLLMTYFTNWDTLLTSWLADSKLSYIARFLYLARVFNKAQRYNISYEILNCATLKLYESRNQWPYSSHSCDVTFRNDVFKHFLSNAYKENLDMYIDLYKKVFHRKFDGFDQMELFNEILKFSLENKNIYSIRDIWQDVITFHSKLDKNLLRAYYLYVNDKKIINSNELQQLYRLCLKLGIYTNYSGQEQFLYIPTNYSNHEITVTITNYFKKVANFKPNSVTINIVPPNPTDFDSLPTNLKKCYKSVNDIYRSIMTILETEYFISIPYPVKPSIYLEQETVQNIVNQI